MEILNTQTKKILEKSKEVLMNCCLPNGAIIAADVNNPIYPSNVKWYGFVWERDAAYILRALLLLGKYKIIENHFNWCLNRADGIREGFFAHKYFPNGTVAGDFDIDIEKVGVKNKKLIKNFIETKLFYVQFQPDGPASLLWILYEYSKHKNVEKFRELVEILANGICKHWKKTHFSLPNYDLWEERVALPDYEQNHIYTLAACIKGLDCALKIEENEKWKNVREQMKKVFEDCYNYAKEKGCFPRTYGKEGKIDNTPDSSLLALVWPWEIVEAHDEVMCKTVGKILQKNEINGGIIRYEGDKYDGRVKRTKLELCGAGAWPILNYWVSIYFYLRGEKERALKYFNWVNKRSLDGYLPEQIKNDKPASIIPLAWSHAMFVIALNFLIDNKKKIKHE